MTVLFFMWGFMTVWNDILIPRFKEAFSLNYFQATLVQFAFFGAYAVGSLAYYLLSLFSGDPISRIGYKNGVVLGLTISAVGSALFYPAAVLVSYPLFLVALFVVGLGFALLQIAANPYVTILGPERTAPSRLNLSQSFNSFGTTIGPLIGGWLIFSVFTKPGQHGAESVKLPYLCFAAIFLLLAVLFLFARLPAFRSTEAHSGSADVFRHPHLVLGVFAIFMYVGGEVSVGSLIVSFLGSPHLGGISHEAASHYLAFYWGGLMIGRFMGAFSLSEMDPAIKRTLVVLTPVVAFLVVLFAHPAAEFFQTGNTAALAGFYHNTDAMPYGLLLALLLVMFFLAGNSAGRMLATFSVTIMALLVVAMVAPGGIAKWAILGIGLFCSVMWSNIFSLAIEGLGALKSQASSLLVMAVLGGALLPPLQGAFADRWGIEMSFIVPLVAFAYTAFYGWKGHRVGRPKSA